MTKKDYTEPNSEILNLYNEICTMINWVEIGKFRQTSDIKIDLMNKYPFKDIDKVEKFCHDLRDRLGDSVHNYATFNNLDDFVDFGESDSSADCLKEIVSMGYEKYSEFYEKPQLVIDYFQADKYKESFSYCFPYEDDYEYADLEFYKNKVKKIREKIPKLTLNLDSKNNIENLLLEIEKGIFDKNKIYNSIYQDSKKLRFGAEIANLWSDGLQFYGKIKKDVNFNDV